MYFVMKKNNKALHPCEFAETARKFYLVDQTRGTEQLVTVPKGVPTLNELVLYRKYQAENQHKPNDWEALEPIAVWINGAIIEDVAEIDRLASDSFSLSIISAYDPLDPAHKNAGMDWFTGIPSNLSRL